MEIPFITPTRDEYGMFHAKAAAMRSAALGRQVGAVIATVEGEIVSVGTNEVPKAGGGLYWCDDEGDARDFHLGRDSVDEYKQQMLGEVLERLKGQGLFIAEAAGKATADLVEDLLTNGDLPAMRGAQMMNVLEYGRIVHAEMAAIVEASRRGVAVQGCTLYTTTFPRHNCARHIVAAGLKRVVYVEPYPKSLASQLHMDALALDADRKTGDQVLFESYVGVAPSRYLEYFEMPQRKDASGKVVYWSPTESVPRGVDAFETTYLSRESKQMDSLKGLQ